jgi:hypothetical protein
MRLLRMAKVLYAFAQKRQGIKPYGEPTLHLLAMKKVDEESSEIPVFKSSGHFHIL